MKKRILLFLVVILTLVACNRKRVEDARRIKIGQSIIEVKYIMGEPIEIQVDDDGEQWKYHYYCDDRMMWMTIKIKNDKVISFKSI